MKATVYCGLSIDGYIARPDGSVDFLDVFDPPLVDGEPSDMGFGELMESIDALIMGRNTFDMVMSMVDDQKVDWPYGDTPVIVMTSRSVEVPDTLSDTVEATDLGPRELLEVLSARLVEHVYVDGGLTVRNFIEAGLIDELIL
ncbi:MAG: dihydrofolate reductase, partial [Acidimicrobiales bacterium]